MSQGDLDQGIGLISKYRVQRTDGSDLAGGRHEGAQYFVLDVTHDPLARKAILDYATRAEDGGYHRLADDLRQLHHDTRDAHAEWMSRRGRELAEERLRRIAAKRADADER